MKRRVVVTGMGLRTPIGNDLESFSQGLKAGRTGVIRMPEWEQVANLRTRVAGVVDSSGSWPADGSAAPATSRAMTMEPDNLILGRHRA